MHIIDVMQQNAQGAYIWLVVREVVEFIGDTIPTDSDKARRNALRKVERWCASGRLRNYAHTATRHQVAELILAGRIRGFPPDEVPLYLIHRDGLAHVHERRKRTTKNSR
jgi:hypothetical protein